jgi:chromosome segregation ATPase
MNFQKTSLTLACIALLGVFGAGAVAQTLDGKATGSGKVMSIHELRACIKQQEGLKSQRQDIEQRRARLDAERVEIEKDTQVLKPLRDEVVARNEKIKAFNEKNNAFAARVNAFNERSEEVKKSGRTGPALDRLLREQDKEQRELKSADAALKEEGKGLMDGVQERIDELNARTDASQKRASLWNERNKQWETDASVYEDKRMDWSANCGGRRFREDDEKAIRAEMK